MKRNTLPTTLTIIKQPMCMRSFIEKSSFPGSSLSLVPCSFSLSIYLSPLFHFSLLDLLSLLLFLSRVYIVSLSLSFSRRRLRVYTAQTRRRGKREGSCCCCCCYSLLCSVQFSRDSTFARRAHAEFILYTIALKRHIHINTYIYVCIFTCAKMSVCSDSECV